MRVESAYYNEIDPYAAQWLRNLITAGHIAPGDVDERSIEDVRPDDLRGYTQCHFFAGIGVWSYALRQAGWPDDRPVWTGSCPCQPFSTAGKGAGFADERHLWPAWHHLISECRPPVILGEQVASKDIDPWIDLVQADMEALDHAFGCVPFPSAGIGAPHIRDRAYWMAYANHSRSQGRRRVRERAAERTSRSRGMAGRLADHHEHGRAAQANAAFHDAECDVEPCGSARGMADASGGRRLGRQGVSAGSLDDRPHAGRIESHDGSVGSDEARISRIEPAGPTNGLWRDADWLLCRDGKWRPVESQPQPLVDGSAESLGLVRADIIAALTEEINATAMEAKVIGTAAMRNVFEALGTEAERCWPSRGIPGLHEAPFLLAFVRQLATQGWLLAQGIPLSRPEATGEGLRGMRDDKAVASASHRRGLDEQRPVERTDIVRILSCVLARHAQAAWGEAYKTYAAVGFPLSSGEPARGPRLKGYGNAINAEAARVFIESVMEIV